MSCVEWFAHSLDHQDVMNAGILLEYQCRACAKSFWVPTNDPKPPSKVPDLIHTFEKEAELVNGLMERYVEAHKAANSAEKDRVCAEIYKLGKLAVAYAGLCLMREYKDHCQATATFNAFVNRLAWCQKC